jgi:hypothetical protein
MITCIYAIPRLNKRINETLRLPNITVSETAEIDLIPGRIAVLIATVQESFDADDGYIRLINSLDRLCEQIAEADSTLDRLHKRTA